jgi:Tfp pilus assembly protein PilZ
MDSVLKQTKPSAPAATGRRKRSAIPVPITISAVDKDGQSFREDSRTLVITRHGMMVETIHRLNLGTEITVENPALGRKSTGRVVWCGAEQATSQVNEIGIYLTDAEGLCGVELAPEEAEQRPAAQSERHRLEKPPASTLAEPRASGEPDSEPGASLRTLPPQPAVPEPIQPLPYKADEGNIRELDLTSELGQVEAASRGLKSATFPVLDRLPEPPGELAESTPELLTLPPMAPARIPTEALLPAEQVNSAVEAALSLLERRIGEIVPAQFGQFEQKLEVLAQQSLSLVQARLQESVAGLEPKLADLVERETASLTDRLRGAQVQVEGLVTRLEELREQVHTSLPASVAREEEEYAAELELRMEETLARHLAAAEDRLQHSRTVAEGLLSQIEQLRQKAHGDLQEWAGPPTQESSALLEQTVTAVVEQHLASLGDRIQNSRAEVDGLLARLEEQRQRAEAGLQESASRLEGESVVRLEQRISTALDQQLAAVADRLGGSSAYVEGLLARLEEQRQRAGAGLQESVSRLEGESAVRLEQRISTALEQQLAAVADRLRGSSAEVEGLLARLEDQRQRAEAGFQESASRLEGESAVRLEQRISTALEQQLAAVADRLRGSSAEVEGLLARLEEQRQRAEAGLQESASRLEGESAVRLEQRISTALDQQLASMVDRLQGPRAEVDGWLGRLEETRQQAQRSLEEAAGRLEGDSGARLEQKITATLESQIASTAERLQSAQAAVESLLIHVEETGRQIQGSLQGSFAEIQEKVASSSQQHFTAVDERLERGRLEEESLRVQLEQVGQEARSGLQELATRLEQESATRLEEKMRLSLDQQMASVLDRLQSSQVEIQASLIRLQEVEQQIHTNLQESATRLEQRIAESLGQQLVAARECLQGARLEAESAAARFEELQQRSHAVLQESVANWEKESASRLESRMTASLEQHVASAEGRLQDALTQLKGLLTKLEDSRESVQQSLQQSFAQVREGIAALVEAQKTSLGERLQGARAEMEALLARLEESRRQAEVKLTESATRLEENTTASLEQHANESAKRLQSSRTEIESMMAGFEETRRQVQQDLQDSAAQLEQRVNAFLDQHLATVENRVAGMSADAESLVARLEQLQQASEAEITKARATLRDLGSQTVQFAVEGVNAKLETDGERTLTQFRSRSAEIVESECYALSQRVCSASDFIRDWSQQAASRLGSYSERIEARAAASAESRQKQAEQIVAGFGERLHNDADVVLSEVLDRVQQTSRLLENTTVAAVQAKVQKGTQDLVETTAVQLRQLAQENLDMVAKQFAERQQQFTGELSAALRRTFDELVEASSAKVRKLTDDSLNLITDQLATRQRLLIDDTTKAFRQKVGEILAMLQNGSGEST